MQMIKYIILTLLTLSSFIQTIQSQNLDSLGIDDSPYLNQFESEYFNEILKDQRENFSFNNAKAIFVTGNSGKKIIQKKEYFNGLIKPWLIKNNKPQTFFIFLNEKEKAKSGGYDIIILSWVKVFTKRKQKRIIRKMRKKT